MNKKQIRIHVLCWLVWGIVSHTTAFIFFRRTQWDVLLVHFLLQVALFYTLHFFALRYFSNIIHKPGNGLWQHYARYFLLRRELAAMAGAVTGYIVIAWLADSYLLTNAWPGNRAPNFWFYADGRFSRAGFYIGAAFFYSAIKAILPVKNKLICWQQEFIGLVRQDNQRLRYEVKQEQEKQKKLVDRLFGKGLN